MEENKIEALEAMFPDGFIVIVPRKKTKKYPGMALYYANPKASADIDLAVEDIVFAMNGNDGYWGIGDST